MVGSQITLVEDESTRFVSVKVDLMWFKANADLDPATGIGLSQDINHPTANLY